MNLESAIDILQIPNGAIPNDEYLKKRYRFIANKIHPDKFTNPRDKLFAHHNFLELQDAYEYLLSKTITERYSRVDTATSEFEPEDNVTNVNYESSYVEKKNPFDWLYILIMPGAILNLMFLSIPMVITIFFDKDVTDKSNNKAEYIGNLILYFLFGALPMLVAFGGILYIAYDKIESGSWLWSFIAVQIVLANLYFIMSYLKRKLFSRKIRKDLIFRE